MTHDPDALVTAAMARNEFEAQTLVAVLREAGIQAVTFDAGSRGLGIPMTGGMIAVPVQVRAAELDQARDALRRNVSDSIDLNWDEIDVGGRDESGADLADERIPLPARVGLRLVAIVVIAMLLGLVIVGIRTFR